MGTDIILFLTGIVIGNMNAIAGGGGLVGFPIMIALGLPPIVADATNFVAILPGQVSSAIGYRKYLAKVPRVYLLLLIPCIGGATIGAHFLRHTSFDNFEKLIPFLILLSVLIFAAQPLLHFHMLRHLRSHHKSAIRLVTIGGALFVMTILGGYFGAGLGFTILALLSFTRLHEVHTLNGLKNITSITVVTTAMIGIYSAHLIDWNYGLIIAAGSLIGGYTGSRLAQKVPSQVVRLVVIVIGLVTAGYLAIKYQ